jgi:hypothetical protein
MIPLVPFTGVIVKLLPLQIIAVMLLTDGVGFTVTVTVKLAPVQIPDAGVTV